MATSWSEITETQASTSNSFPQFIVNTSIPNTQGLVFQAGGNDGIDSAVYPSGFIYATAVTDGMSPTELKELYFPDLIGVIDYGSGATWIEAFGAFVGTLTEITLTSDNEGALLYHEGNNVFSLKMADGALPVPTLIFRQSYESPVEELYSELAEVVSNTKASTDNDFTIVSTTDIASSSSFTLVSTTDISSSSSFTEITNTQV